MFSYEPSVVRPGQVKTFLRMCEHTRASSDRSASSPVTGVLSVGFLEQARNPGDPRFQIPFTGVLDQKFESLFCWN